MVYKGWKRLKLQNKKIFAYRKGQTIVYREIDNKWYRMDLPPETFVMALEAAAMSAGGIFTRTSGPFNTMKEAIRG
jgi:hypothetical protein